MSDQDCESAMKAYREQKAAAARAKAAHERAKEAADALVDASNIYRNDLNADTLATAKEAERRASATMQALNTAEAEAKAATNTFILASAFVFFNERDGSYVKDSNGKLEWVPGEGGYVQDSKGKWEWVPGEGSYVQDSNGKWEWVPTTRMMTHAEAEAKMEKLLNKAKISSKNTGSHPNAGDRIEPHKEYLMGVLAKGMPIINKVKGIKPGHLARLNLLLKNE